VFKSEAPDKRRDEQTIDENLLNGSDDLNRVVFFMSGEKGAIMAKGEKIILFDTTLRDGGQTRGVHFSVEDKIKLTRELDEMGFEYIEGGWPGSNPKDIHYFEEMKKIRLHHAKLSSFSSTRLKDTDPAQDKILAELLKAETPVFTLFGKAWDMHVSESLGTSLEENLAMIHSTVAYLKPRGDEVVYDAEHYFDGYKANPEYALQTIKAAADAGADWIVLADTNGGALPEEVRIATRPPWLRWTHRSVSTPMMTAICLWPTPLWRLNWEPRWFREPSMVWGNAAAMRICAA